MMPVPTYIICATPRSGSTLLCDLLTDTGVAGHPNSFYRQLSIPYWIKSWGVTEPLDSPGFDRAYLDAVLQAGSPNTGMFGMRLMWNGVEDMMTRFEHLYPGRANDAARIEAAIGPPKYLFLSREDKVAQAVSRYRAEQGGLWHLNADGSERERVKREDVTYDSAGIATYLAEVEADNQAWENWFVRNQITPFRLRYEPLAEDPRNTLALVLAELGLEVGLANEVAPRTKKLASLESQNWVSRFKADHG